MLTKNFITSSLILFAGFNQYVYAIEDVSLPSQVLQDQRLKELNQQLQDQLAQQTPYQSTKSLQDFKHLDKKLSAKKNYLNNQKLLVTTYKFGRITNVDKPYRIA